MSMIAKHKTRPEADACWNRACTVEVMQPQPGRGRDKAAGAAPASGQQGSCAGRSAIKQHVSCVLCCATITCCLLQKTIAMSPVSALACCLHYR